jgi:hypothetical protein
MQGALTGGGAARGVAGSDARRRGRRGAEEAGRDVGRHEVRRRRAGQTTWGWVAWGQELRCWSGSVGSGGWGGRARGWSVGLAGVGWIVGSR